MVQVRELAAPAVDREQILRYALCRSADESTEALLEACLTEALPVLSYRVCWKEFSVEVRGSDCDFGSFRLRSRALAKHLRSCHRAVIFAATLGVGMDRLIARYGRVSPARGLMMQAVGTERIEALCDAFCAEFAGAASRFSPGYGDLKLEAQRDIFSQLCCEKHIGLTLNDSLVMSPSKSVTAVVGLTNSL